LKHRNSDSLNSLQGKVQTAVSKIGKNGTDCKLIRKVSKKATQLHVENDGAVVAIFDEDDLDKSSDEIRKTISNGIDALKAERIAV